MKKTLTVIAMMSTCALILSGCSATKATASTTGTRSSSAKSSSNASGGSSTSSNKPQVTNITISSQESEEATIDDYILKDLIQAKYPSIHVTIKKTSAGSGLMHQMILKGDAQIYVGYDGTEFSGPLKQPYTSKWKSDPSKVLQYVQDQEMKKWNIWVSPSLGFEDTYAIAVTAATAKKYNLKTDSDVVKYSKNWTVATDDTFQARKGDGYSDFAKTYGLQFKSAKAMSYDLMYPSLAKGDVNAAIVYSTDGRLKKLNEVPLTDDKHFFPPYHGIILANDKVYKEDNLSAAFKPLYGKLTTSDQTELNYLVTVKKESESKVAHDWLVKQGLLSS